MTPAIAKALRAVVRALAHLAMALPEGDPSRELAGKCRDQAVAILRRHA